MSEDEQRARELLGEHFYGLLGSKGDGLNGIIQALRDTRAERDAEWLSALNSREPRICSRCAMPIARSFAPGRCHADDCEPMTLDEHDEAITAGEAFGAEPAEHAAELERAMGVVEAAIEFARLEIMTGNIGTRLQKSLITQGFITETGERR